MSGPNLADLAAELRAIADAHPWDPLTLAAPHPRHWRRLDLDGCRFRFMVCLTRTEISRGRKFYMLSIGDPALPESVVQAVVDAFLPGSTDMGASPTCRKFVAGIEGLDG